MPFRKVQFRSIYSTSEEENHMLSELDSQHPLTKGWISARYCLFPQYIVLRLTKRTRVKKLQLLFHEYMIPTNVEIAIGDKTDDNKVDFREAIYHKLGHIKPSNNMMTNFAVRELRSISVDAVGIFVKLALYNNYPVHKNTCNQVALIAVNVIGSEIPTGTELVDVSTAELHGVSGPFSADYISPLDDLAFAMYQDPEVADTLRKLEREKQSAVIKEDYQRAQLIKQTMTELQKIGESVARLEVDKRAALRVEDFLRAQELKDKIIKERELISKKLGLHRLLTPEASSVDHLVKDVRPTSQVSRVSGSPKLGQQSATVNTPDPLQAAVAAYK